MPIPELPKPPIQQKSLIRHPPLRTLLASPLLPVNHSLREAAKGANLARAGSKGLAENVVPIINVRDREDNDRKGRDRPNPLDNLPTRRGRRPHQDKPDHPINPGNLDNSLNRALATAIGRIIAAGTGRVGEEIPENRLPIRLLSRNKEHFVNGVNEREGK